MEFYYDYLLRLYIYNTLFHHFFVLGQKKDIYLHLVVTIDTAWIDAPPH